MLWTQWPICLPHLSFWHRFKLVEFSSQHVELRVKQYQVCWNAIRSHNFYKFFKKMRCSGKRSYWGVLLTLWLHLWGIIENCLLMIIIHRKRVHLFSRKVSSIEHTSSGDLQRQELPLPSPPQKLNFLHMVGCPNVIDGQFCEHW